MNSKHLKILIFLIAALIFMTACSGLPHPEELMRPPIGSKSTYPDIKLDAFVPVGMELLTPSNSGGRYRVSPVDIEDDGESELLIYFGIPEELTCRGFAILNYYGNWYTTYKEEYDENYRYNVENVEFENLTGAGNREMIVELSTFNGARIFTIFMFTPEPVQVCRFGADKVDVIKQEGNNPILAVWNYGDGGFEIDLVRWDWDGFTAASYDAPGYFANLIPSFEKSAERGENGLLYLADVLLKAGDYKSSLEAADRFAVSERENELMLKCDAIRARCLYNLGHTEAAFDALPVAQLTSGYDPDLVLEICLLITDMQTSNGYADAAAKTLESCEKLLYNYLNSDYRLHLWKTEIEKRRERLSNPGSL